MRNIIPAAFLAALALSACGGGGNLAPQSVAVANPSPKPNANSIASLSSDPSAAPTFPPSTASVVSSGPTSLGATYASSPSPSIQSASALYLPFSVGNAWTFPIKTKITDAASGTITCSCPVNNYPIERFDITNSDGTQGVSLIFARGTWLYSGLFSGDYMTYFVGTSNNGGSKISYFYYSSDGQIPGIPVADDTPQVGESFSLASGTFGVTSTPGNVQSVINSIGGTAQVGPTTVQNVAASSYYTSNSGQGYAFSFAPGVGFVSFAFWGNATSATVNSSSI